MTFSEKLITLRAGRSWSQERLAEELGVTRQAVGRWEKGAGLPDAVSLTRLALVFDVAPEWLLDEAAPDEPEPRRRRAARFEWFDFLALALFVLGLAVWYAVAGVGACHMRGADAVACRLGAPALRGARRAPASGLRSRRRALLRRRQGPRVRFYPAVSLSLRPRRLRPPARPRRETAGKMLSGVVHFKVYSLKSQ